MGKLSRWLDAASSDQGRIGLLEPESPVRPLARSRTHLSESMPPTSWSLLAAARGRDAAAERALSQFALRYARPVQAYLSALAGKDELARDLTQSFFTERVLEGHLLEGARAYRGSFRRYLKRAVRNYFIDWCRREARDKRGGGMVDSLSNLGSADEIGDDGIDSQPDLSFHRAWVRTLLDEALDHVEQLCFEKAQLDHYEIFCGRYLAASISTPSWEELGGRHGLDEKAARGRAETVARHFRNVLRGMLHVELGSAADVNQELAILRTLLER